MHGPSQGAGPNIIPARILARYPAYVSATGPNRFEVAPLCAATPERHSGDFAAYRNRIGGLLLLPKGFNASYSALPYEDKLPHYNRQNLLARSLHPLCYEHNPGFLRFTREMCSAWPFACYGNPHMGEASHGGSEAKRAIVIVSPWEETQLHLPCQTQGRSRGLLCPDSVV